MPAGRGGNAARAGPSGSFHRNSKTLILNGPLLRARRQLAAVRGSSRAAGATTITIMDLVAGVDSSTQSTKVLLCRADDGTVVGSASAPHPDGTECHPDHWWEALSAAGRGLLDRAAAIGVGAQQHGMVVLDSAGDVIRDAMLWNDVKSAPQAAQLVAEFGGAAEWAARTGSVPTMSFTVTKLRWLAE